MLRLILELPIQAPNQPTAKADSTKKDLYLWIIYMGALPPIIGAAPGILRVEFSGQKTTLPPPRRSLTLLRARRWRLCQRPRLALRRASLQQPNLVVRTRRAV